MDTSVHPGSAGRPRGLVQGGQIAMQPAGMAVWEGLISLQCSSAPAPFQVPCSAHPAFLFILLLSLLTTGLCTSIASSISASQSVPQSINEGRGSAGSVSLIQLGLWVTTGVCSWPSCSGALQKC